MLLFQSCLLFLRHYNVLFLALPGVNFLFQSCLLFRGIVTEVLESWNWLGRFNPAPEFRGITTSLFES
jgi:hypothetical protein